MKKRLIALLLVLALLIPVGVASAATWYRVNTSSLKVRYLPDDSANVLGSYRKDYACTVSSTKDGWSYVTFSNGTEGYVLAKYITKASSYKAWVTKDDTSMRKGPDGNFSAVATLAKGTKVTVQDTKASDLNMAEELFNLIKDGFEDGYSVPEASK